MISPRTLLIRTLQGIAVVTALLLLQASTGNASTDMASFIELGKQTALVSAERDERPQVDQLRAICAVKWPTSVAGADTEAARRKACRAFGS